MYRKSEQASNAASVSAFAATGSLYDGSPVYGSYLDMEPMKLLGMLPLLLKLL